MRPRAGALAAAAGRRTQAPRAAGEDRVSRARPSVGGRGVRGEHPEPSPYLPPGPKKQRTKRLGNDPRSALVAGRVAEHGRPPVSRGDSLPGAPGSRSLRSLTSREVFPPRRDRHRVDAGGERVEQVNESFPLLPVQHVPPTRSVRPEAGKVRVVAPSRRAKVRTNPWRGVGSARRVAPSAVLCSGVSGFHPASRLAPARGHPGRDLDTSPGAAKGSAPTGSAPVYVL